MAVFVWLAVLVVLGGFFVCLFGFLFGLVFLQETTPCTLLALSPLQTRTISKEVLYQLTSNQVTSNDHIFHTPIHDAVLRFVLFSQNLEITGWLT